MIDERLKNLRGASRRDFIKWSTVMAAALGLERLPDLRREDGGHGNEGGEPGRPHEALHRCLLV